MKIVCIKAYACADPVTGVTWAPGAVLDLPDKVAKLILENSAHSFAKYEEPVKTKKDEEVK